MSKELGRLIKTTREAWNVSAKSLAELLSTEDIKVDENNVYKWEKGSTPSHPVIFERLMTWLNKSENGKKSEFLLMGETRITIQDHINEIKNSKQELKDQNEFLKEVIRAALTDIGINLSKVLKETAVINSAVPEESSETASEGQDENRTILASRVLGGKLEAQGHPDELGNIPEEDK